MTDDTNTIEELRRHLFDTVRALRDPTNPMDIERARTVSDVSQTIINTVKAETDFLKSTGATGGDGKVVGSGFIPVTPRAALPAPTPATEAKSDAKPKGATTATVAGGDAK